MEPSLNSLRKMATRNRRLSTQLESSPPEPRHACPLDQQCAEGTCKLAKGGVFDPPFLPPPRPRFLSPPSPAASSRSALVVHGSNLGRRLAAIVSSLGITAIPRKTTDASTPSSVPARDVPPRAVVVVVFDNASHARRARAFVDAGCVGRASYRSSGSSPGRTMISFANRRAYMSTDVRLSLARASRIAALEPFENVTARRRR